jgi:hypothetical protein
VRWRLRALAKDHADLLRGRTAHCGEGVDDLRRGLGESRTGAELWGSVGR